MGRDPAAVRRRGRGRPTAAERERFAVLRGLCDVVTRLADDAPFVLCVDDVQWSDEASVQFLAYLVQAPRGATRAARAGDAHRRAACGRRPAGRAGRRRVGVGAASGAAVRAGHGRPGDRPPRSERGAVRRRLPPDDLRQPAAPAPAAAGPGDPGVRPTRPTSTRSGRSARARSPRSSPSACAACRRRSRRSPARSRCSGRWPTCGASPTSRSTPEEEVAGALDVLARSEILRDGHPLGLREPAGPRRDPRRRPHGRAPPARRAAEPSIQVVLKSR